MTSIQHPTRRHALQLAAGAVAIAALPVPALTRLQALAGPIGPSANLLWKPVDDAPRVAASSDDRSVQAAGA
ncbi:hypothetical protein [Variovorax paradoxus]|jgi:hypothetical protein|uniref:hypothetical protein n=1 Tax=Variovorax paradoxus TaxID=34073 RepID=UPI0029C63DEB|nr:hypothetical protein [Variovorax paradoxus]WPH23561.1 hypothetical protein RZE78_31440 [Variovorax paradoxus]